MTMRNTSERSKKAIRHLAQAFAVSLCLLQGSAMPAEEKSGSGPQSDAKSQPWRTQKYPEDHKPLPMMSYVGVFEKLPDRTKQDHVNKAAHERAERIVSDAMFSYSREGRKLNMWAVLEQYEGAFGIDTIPHAAWDLNNAANYIEKTYGKPDEITVFRSDDGKVFNVRWYGPISLLCDDKGSTREYGGWPSRINQQTPQPKAILPAYKWLIMPGNNTLTAKSRII